MLTKIYLHWTATPYDWKQPNHYHIVITKDEVVRLHQNNQKLSHTFGRNTNSIGIAVACMGGRGWKDYPPTPGQIEKLCATTAQVATRLGYKLEDINIKNIMTHAEAAANRDFPIHLARKVSGRRPMSSVQANEFDQEAKALGMPHANYGPQIWHDNWPGGYAERWDLAQLKPTDKMGIGGFRLRERIQQLWMQMNSGEKPQTPLMSG